MNQLNRYKIECKTAKNGQEIPVINEIHLHSSYNPEREAAGFCKSIESKLHHNQNFLVLGLGFGYHIQQITKYLKSINKDSYRIVVLEPNSELPVLPS